MQALVADLLEYSRAGTQALRCERVNMAHSLKNVLNLFEARMKEAGARIIVNDLPEVECDRLKIEQVLQNLIGNALKFKSNRRPEITIGCDVRERGRIFFVRDNGIGFDPAYRDKIFIMFQRLHGFGEYTGSGMGLAICKRIIEAHGGRIWAESLRGDGSTFYFTLPFRHASSAAA
jgi:chemotaxis family two-component system sensor kinase Cph1